MAEKIKAAILVDADNMPIAQAEQALTKLAEICNPVVKKAFGDFTGSAKGWTPEFMRWHGFTPVLHFPVTRFKNGADIAMCIAAMDIVHAKSVDTIVIFTSDSDFAALAARIRESGMTVVGVGDAKANTVLQGAFDTFVVVDPPKPTPKPAPVVPTSKSAPKKAQPKAKPVEKDIKEARDIIDTALTKVATKKGWHSIAKVLKWISDNFPEFQAKDYGANSFLGLLRRSQIYILEPIKKSTRMKKK